jgi:hydroxymethylglutaryl-CoA lyase
MLYKYVEVFTTMGLKTFPFSDIFGNVSPIKINEVFKLLNSEFSEVEFGLHLHSLDNGRLEKVDAAYKAGIRRFDTVINGIGGCPQTGKELIGNLPLQEFLGYCNENNIPTDIDEEKVSEISKYNLY